MKYKLMIVDDEKNIRENLMLFDWDSIGVQASFSCENGLAAIEILKNHSVDIVLTDIRMPLMGGVELVAFINQQFPNIYTVCLSGYSDYEYLRATMQNKASDYLLKPVDKDELFAIIKEITDRISLDQKLKTVRVSDIGNEKNSENKLDVKSHKYIIGNAIEYIKNNYFKNISLEDVANEIYINPVYLSHLFKKVTNVRFVDYLTDCRIACAKKMLSDPFYKIQDIAKAVGYESARYFTEVFKKKTGVTPYEYRSKK